MTEHGFQTAVLESLGKLTGEVSETRAEVRHMCSDMKNMKVDFNKRITKLENHESQEVKDAIATGEHQIEKLQNKLAFLDKEDKAVKLESKKQWLGFVTKAGIMIIGAIIASLFPALAKAIGL